MPDTTRRQRILKAIALLTEHNRWRRGEEMEPTNPAKLGQAIDTLAEVEAELKELEAHRNKLADSLWCAEDQWGDDYLWNKWNLSEHLTEELKKDLRK